MPGSDLRPGWGLFPFEKGIFIDLLHYFENLFGDWEEMCTFAASSAWGWQRLDAYKQEQPTLAALFLFLTFLSSAFHNSNMLQVN